MSAKNPLHSIQLNHVIKAVTVTDSATNTDSTSVDALGFTEATLYLQFGTTTGSSATAQVLAIASNATGGTYAAITGAASTAAALDSGGLTNKFVVIPINLTGKNRWLKIRVTTVGSTLSTGAMQGYIVLGGSVNNGLPEGATLHPEGGVQGRTAYDTVVAYVT